MRRLIMLLTVGVVVGLLMLAAAVPAFAKHSPSQGNQAPDDTIGHFASCTAQGEVLHSPGISDLPNYDSLHQLYHEECEADHELP